MNAEDAFDAALHSLSAIALAHRASAPDEITRLIVDAIRSINSSHVSNALDNGATRANYIECAAALNKLAGALCSAALETM